MRSKSDKKKSLVPRLRFPEFREAGAWEVKRLGGVLSLKYGASLPEDQRTEGPFPVVGSNGVVGYHSEPLIDGPAIVIGRKGSAGEINWIESACFPIDTTFYVMLRRHSDRLDFIKSLLERHSLPDLVSPGGVPGLNRDDVYAVRTAIPKPEEQQKIAHCLSSLDEVIGLQAKKVQALKQHKKGLMQQLFPAEGETTPRLRFPEFREAGAWEVKWLGEVCEINPSTGGLPDNFIYIDLESVVAGQLVKKQKISKEGAPSRAQRVLESGDVIYQTVRPYQKNNYLFDLSDGNRYVASTGYAQFRAHDSENFLFQLIHTDTLINKVLSRCTGSNYPAINSSDLSKIQVVVPRTDEQQKIAHCLSSLDEVIGLESHKLDALKNLKKGLMQQLFPQEVA